MNIQYTLDESFLNSLSEFWLKNYRPYYRPSQTRKETWITMPAKKPLTAEQKRNREEWERIKSEAVDVEIIEETKDF